MAGRRRSGKSHRLQADTGPLHDGRQSVQCLSCRRQRPGAHCRGCAGRHRGPRRKSVPFRSRKSRIAPGRTSLGKGEIVESILLPKRPPRSSDAYLRFIPRSEMDIAVVYIAGVNLVLDAKGVIKEARVALGAVAPTVLLVGASAAKAIIGTKLDDEALKKILPRPARPRASSSTTKEARSSSEPRSQVCWQGAGCCRKSRISAQEANNGWRTCFNHGQRRSNRGISSARPMSRCSTCCATGWA